MKFTVKSEHPASVKSGCVILGVFERRKLSEPASRFNKTTRGLLEQLLADGDMDGKPGQTLLVHAPRGAKCDRVLLVGCGKSTAFDSRAYSKTVTSAAKAVNDSGASDAISYLAELEVSGSDHYHVVRTHVELTQSALYKPDVLKSKKDTVARPLRRLSVNTANDTEDESRRAVADGEAIAAGVELARSLGDLPGNLCTPTHLANTARELGKTSKLLKVSVMAEATMKKLGMGALLSVSRGSEEPARLISIEYSGGNKGDTPVDMGGKGGTFDAGGRSIKPPAAMDEMKYDM